MHLSTNFWLLVAATSCYISTVSATNACLQRSAPSVFPDNVGQQMYQDCMGRRNIPMSDSKAARKQDKTPTVIPAFTSNIQNRWGGAFTGCTEKISCSDLFGDQTGTVGGDLVGWMEPNSPGGCTNGGYFLHVPSKNANPCGILSIFPLPL